MDRRQTESPGIDWARYPIPRVRHHANPQVYMPASQQHMIAPWYPPTREEAVWGSWFSNGLSANVLDLGCGRGAFLLQHALTHPERNILGIEVRSVLADYINEVARGEGLGNAHAEWYTLANGLDWIEPESIDYAVYLFPDPWPKKRHHKRRAFTTEFLALVQRVLKPGARLWLATDRPDVDAYQREVIDASPLFEIQPLADDESWPFAFRTDQQMFCDAKGIPYVRYSALRLP
jgi:tRNA (guanine-N(7)-)-methyltransferase